MPEETREQHVARLRELSAIGQQRKLTSPELWEVSRRCAEVGDLTKSRQAADRAKALDDLTAQARLGEAGQKPPHPSPVAHRPVAPPAPRVIHQGPTVDDIAKGTCCGIIMVPFAVVALLFLAFIVLAALGASGK